MVYTTCLGLSLNRHHLFGQNMSLFSYSYRVEYFKQIRVFVIELIPSTFL